MDFLSEKIKTIYFKYLSAAFGSALITSIYSIVDMAMVGQYHGPEGSAALAVVAPVWNIIYSFIKRVFYGLCDRLCHSGADYLGCHHLF